MYHQQTIDWKALKASIDDMFPVKPESTPEPSAVATVFYPDWAKYKGQVAQWLKEIPTPVADTKRVMFVRVNKSLVAQGARLLRGTPKPLPEGVDIDAWLLSYVNAYGLCAETLNAAGEVVSKHTPNDDLQAGKAFI